MKRYTTLLFLLTLLAHLHGQELVKPIGSWTEYLPFQKGTSIDIQGDQIFCGTTTGLFVYNSSDGSISRFSTVNRLNDIRVNKLAYSQHSSTLLIVYQNLNIDLLKNGQTINIPSIREASIPNKTINNIFLKDEFAYLACGFGIVKLNLNRNEISETYQFGSGGGEIDVKAIYVDDSRFYAATEDGLYLADPNKNLLDFNNWTKLNIPNKNNFIDIFFHRGLVHLVHNRQNNDSVFTISNDNKLTAVNLLSGRNYIDQKVIGNRLLYASSVGVRIYDEQYQVISQFNPFLNNLSDITFSNDKVYLINNFDPLLQFNYSGEVLQRIRPDGPFEENIFDIDVNDGILWAVPGGYDQSINNQYRPGRVYRYKEGSWTSFIDFAEPSLGGTYDIISVTANPENPEEVYMGSWGPGLIEYKNQTPFVVYDEENSILVDRQLRPGWVAIGSTTFDDDGNLWMVNSYSSRLIARKTPAGEWSQYDIGNIPSINLESGDETAATEIEVSDAGIVWVSLTFDNHVLAFDPNRPFNTSAIILKQGVDSGDVPGIRGVTMDIDLDNQLWIGTSDGIAVNYNPDNIFDRSPTDRDFERVLIDNGENVEILLEGTEINDIETDGANRKWVATNGAGVFLLSEDGKEEILQLTVDNSPLFSNNVLRIAIDDKSGEVYMATAAGLISYRSDVVSGEESLSDIKVFPNPVRESYDGPIAIDGLMDQTRIKITDIEGRLVNEIESRGGRALWNGKNFNGERVSTGVYLVFSSALNEEENLRTAIGKILFIR